MRHGVAIIGCGLIGSRRAGVAAADGRTHVNLVIDNDLQRAREVAKAYNCDVSADWRDVLVRDDVGIVVAATPNKWLAEISIAALAANKHVLAEKPMGRNLKDAQAMAAAATAAKALLKIGFNHRYHPAIAEAHARFIAGEIGSVINVRARYGHGGRPGYEREWRGSAELAGGGELTDQGVHVADLVHWFAGLPAEAFGMLQTAVWPLEPLEDNGFGLFRFGNGAVASIHTSWTQWKNLFSFEIFGDRGSLVVEGLGKSYGSERLRIARRAMQGGAAAEEHIEYDEPDNSWAREWSDFLNAIEHSDPYLGTPGDGLAAMKMIEALYESARTKTIALIAG